MKPEKEVVIADSDPETSALLVKMLRDSPFHLKVVDGPSRLQDLLLENDSSIGCVLVDVRRFSLNGIRSDFLWDSSTARIPLVFITTQKADYPGMSRFGQVVEQPFQKADIINAISQAFELENGKN